MQGTVGVSSKKIVSCKLGECAIISVQSVRVWPNVN